MIWLAVAFCLLVSFMFSGIEAGILSINRVRLRHRVKLRESSAITLQRLLARPERLLVTVLVVTNLMTISAIILSTHQIVAALGQIGYVLSGLIWLPVYLFVIELLPKSLFRRFPYRALGSLTRLLIVADFLLSPFLSAGEWIMRLIFPAAASGERKLFIAREDFKYLTFESEQQGTLTTAAREMIHNVVDFRTVPARDVMTPLEKIQIVRADMLVSDFLKQTRANGWDRVPVAGANGTITGQIDVLDVLLDGRSESKIESFQRRLIQVGAEELAYAVMRKLRAAGVRLAAVQAADGRVVGTINSEELVQKLVKPAVALP